ncbi:MAG: hypothetical protein U5K30_10860 [Acidimicrobiales bacterium]|nr:hypothetical protein [Acidimicrobiales bacterium]
MSWEHRVAAFNTATESANRMHNDAVAATYGYKGGLVPGVDVWAYMTRPCTDRWGLDFLERGIMDATFIAPVYDGEQLTVRLEDDGTLQVMGPDDEVRVTGSAQLVDGPEDLPPPGKLPTVEVPYDPPPASAEALAPGTVLGKLRYKHYTDPAAEYLDAIRETSPLYQAGRIGHPGVLARQANYVLASSVKLGPWIHVSTKSWHRGVVNAGDMVETRGVVVDEFEKNGHRYVDLDVEIAANEAPVWSARHRAIWQPRPAEVMSSSGGGALPARPRPPGSPIDPT